MLPRLALETFNFSVMEFARNHPDVRDAYVLDAPYQRGAVWTTAQKQNLIKSLLLGIPIGAVYINVRPFNHDNPAEHAAVIDGQQRIRAMRAFVDDEIAVPADWFAEAPHHRSGELEVFIESTCGPIDYEGTTVEGVRFSELTSLGQGAFKRCTVGVCKATVPTIEEEAAIYMLVNFGGVEQTDDDRDRAATVASGNLIPAAPTR